MSFSTARVRAHTVGHVTAFEISTTELKSPGLDTGNPASITSDGFQSKTISEYYQQALAAVNELKIGYNFECFDSNIALGLNGNFTDVFAKTLQILQKLFVLILVFVKKNSKKLKKIKKIYKNPLTNRFFGANMSNVIRKQKS